MDEPRKIYVADKAFFRAGPTSAYRKQFPSSIEYIRSDLYEKLLPLYFAANKLMHFIGAYGSVTTEYDCVTEVMDALHDIDEGVDKSLSGAIEVIKANGMVAVPVDEFLTIYEGESVHGEEFFKVHDLMYGRVKAMLAAAKEGV